MKPDMFTLKRQQKKVRYVLPSEKTTIINCILAGKFLFFPQYLSPTKCQNSTFHYFLLALSFFFFFFLCLERNPCTDKSLNYIGAFVFKYCGYQLDCNITKEIYLSRKKKYTNLCTSDFFMHALTERYGSELAANCKL